VAARRARRTANAAPSRGNGPNARRPGRPPTVILRTARGARGSAARKEVAERDAPLVQAAGDPLDLAVDRAGRASPVADTSRGTWVGAGVADVGGGQPPRPPTPCIARADGEGPEVPLRIRSQSPIDSHVAAPLRADGVRCGYDPHGQQKEDAHNRGPHNASLAATRPGATKASQLASVAIALGAVFRDETMAAMSLLGTVLVTAGAYLTSRREKLQEQRRSDGAARGRESPLAGVRGGWPRPITPPGARFPPSWDVPQLRGARGRPGRATTRAVLRAP